MVNVANVSGKNKPIMHDLELVMVTSSSTPILMTKKLQTKICKAQRTSVADSEPDPDLHFLGLADPNPLVRGADPAPDPSLFS